MPKVSVYLPDDLYAAVRARGMRLSAMTQRAIREELDRRPNEAWVARARSRSPRCDRPVDTLAALEEARDEFGA